MRLTSEVLTYLPFLLGSFVFIFAGSMLLFVPEKFMTAGRWWGRKIGLHEAHYQHEPDRSLTWRKWRLPGAYVLCFGLFMLFAALRSLMRVYQTASRSSVVNQNQIHWYAFASDAISVALGLYVLLCTERILARFKNRQPSAEDGLNPVRYLFKAIGALAIIAGLAFLLKHVLALWASGAG